MEALAGLGSPGLRKRSIECSTGEGCSTTELSSVSGGMGSCHTSSGQPKRSRTDSGAQQSQPASSGGGGFFPVFDYHANQQGLQHYPSTQLQPADSSTWSNWRGDVTLASDQRDWPAAAAHSHHAGFLAPPLQQQQQQQQQQQFQQHQQQHMPVLVRASSAPELVELAQADSSVWTQAHAASSGGGANACAMLSSSGAWLL